MHIVLLIFLTIAGIIITVITDYTQNAPAAILAAAIAAIVGIGWASILWRG